MRKFLLIIIVLFWASNVIRSQGVVPPPGTIDGDRNILKCSVQEFCVQMETYGQIFYIAPNGTIEWEVSNNLEIVSGQGSECILVRAINSGSGFVTVNFKENGSVYFTNSAQISVLEYTDEFINYTYTQTSQTPLTLPANASIVGTFTILSGTVIISSTVYCAENAKFVINAGGKLIVDGGKITNRCYGQMWDGIYVVGQKYQMQLAQYQGTLEITNNSTIENAKRAIFTKNTNNNNYSTGGIVKCSNSTFRNNGKCAEFHDYTNHTSGGSETSNVSFFKNCNFTIDDNNFFNLANITYGEMIKMNFVNGISIRGCHFSDTRTGISNRGNAITLSSAGINIKPSCTIGDYNIANRCNCTGENRNTFYGFKKGISVSNNGSNHTLYVMKADFEECETAVDIYAVDNYNIIFSDFNIKSPNGYGIYSRRCNGYKIEGNSFYTTNSAHISSGVTCGIYMYGQGNNNNNIHKNSFMKLERGITSLHNPNLQISCNDFSNNYSIDIFTSGEFPDQGSNSTSAGNKFTPGITNIYTGNVIHYYHSGPYNSNNIYCPYNSNSYYIINMPEVPANSCTSTICTPPIPYPNPIDTKKSANINDDISLYEEMQQAYESRLVKYNAAGYDFLLKNFNKEDDDIVVKAERMQDTLVSIRTVMTEIAKRNINAIFQDTLVFDREALNGWYNRINTITAKYSLVNSYFETGEYELARQELAAIPQRFALNETELAEYDNFCQYHSLRESVFKSDRSYNQLTEEEIAELNIIAERNTGVSSSYANSVLCFFYGICHDEEPEIDFDMDNTPNTPAALEKEKIDAKSIAIYVYPNPADNELNVLFNDLPEGKNTIEFHDVTGRLMLSQEITSSNARIDISSLTQGVYMYRIVNGENVIVRDRIVKE